jgi:hypothetical protein
MEKKLVSWATFSKQDGKHLPRKRRGDCAGFGGVDVVDPTLRAAGYSRRSEDGILGFDKPKTLANQLFKEFSDEINGIAVYHVARHRADMDGFTLNLYFLKNA